MRGQMTRVGITLAALVAFAGIARADGFECKKTETQAECHDRLKCKASEELEDCQKRLRAGGGQQSGGGQQGGDGQQSSGSRGGGGGNDDNGGSRGGGGGGGDSDSGSRGGGGGGGYNDNSAYSRSGGGGHGNYAAHKKFGLGLELGEPDGLNGKVFVAPSGAIDFGLGYIYDHYYYGDGIHIYGDYLWHPVSLASTPSFDLPFYVGVGLRYWNFDYCYQGICGYHDSAVGIRVPFGLSFDFRNAPIDIFLQLVPVLDFLNGDYYMRYGDRAHFGIDASVGLRFWFK